MSLPYKILIAPLDWGLGHATRCLPVIGLLLEEGHSVTLAAPENICMLVKSRFPDIRILSLPGYGIAYSKNRAFFTLRIVRQIPKIIKAIQREHRWLQRIQAIENFDLIISDNRYGLYHVRTRCAIMTHQLEIQTGWGKAANKLLQRLHYRLLEKFDACWIVDYPGKANLGGNLSHPVTKPRNASYIGLLSQFSLTPKQNDTLHIVTGKKDKEILVLLSGPEPMRSQLEHELWAQCQMLSSDYHINFIAGRLGANTPPAVEEGLHYYPCLSGKELASMFQKAALVICRSGYSTLMDLAFFEKKALLIPTPGQTEQEYLARYLHKKWGVAVSKQGTINLRKSIPLSLSANSIKGFDQHEHTLLRDAISKLINRTA